MSWPNNNNTSNAQIHNTFASLGVRHGDTYNVNESCLQILEDILRKLAIEDQTLRTFRRAIGFGQNIKKDLIPLLIYVKDDTKITDATKIIDTTIKILVNLTIPVECLLSIESVSRTDVGRHTIFELNRLLTTSKEAFTDSRSTKAVMDHMKHVVEKDVHLNVQQCDSINNCLLLLRNILHIPENRAIISNCPLAHASMQNEIIWNLFTQSIDKIIIYLMSCPQKMYWGVTMVQLIALMYKDQHVGTLQKLLNLWLEASLSDSSEDNESNTSPPDQGSGDSSPTITSDPTSDSSDNGGSGKSNERAKNTNPTDNIRNKNNTTEVVRAAQNRSKALIIMKRVKSTETETSTSSGISMSQSSDTSISNKSQQQQQSASEKVDNTNLQNGNNNMKKRECPSSQSEVSDCGYVTQVENQESISTSSNDDDQPHQKPIHQKPHTFQKSRYNNTKNRTTTALDKKELRRKKLVKRSKTNIINMKGLMHHTPTDEDISNILKEFTVDFLLKGYGSLVQNLHSQLLTNYQIQIDTSHFFWLVTYFLKFATQLELELEHVSPVLSLEIISYLIYQGVWLYEEFEIICKIQEADLKPCLRRLHLVVTAIREFMQALETYQKMMHLNEEDRISLTILQKQISQMEELKCLFLLLLRQYNPNYQSKQYLQDLILTNHHYLLFMDQIAKDEPNYSNQMMDHLKQFATVELMRQYGQLLENFKENGEYVNNCIFTMMHHIGGDLEHISTLFQPSILKSFSLIWETDYEICDDWSDLIEYVIHKFINSPKNNDCTSPKSIICEESKDNLNLIQTLDTNEWTKEEKANLLTYYNQSKNTSDAISTITRKYEENHTSTKHKTQTSIIKELLEQNIINETQYNDFMRVKRPESVLIIENTTELISGGRTKEDTLNNSDIKSLKEHLFKENKGHLILWLQKIVTEACYVKLVLTNSNALKDIKHVMEPSVYYYTLLNLPIPVVPWTAEQNNILNHQPFILLLHKLGFYLPADTGKVFVRIPNFWTAEYLFTIAQQLGPIDDGKLKFNINLLDGINKTEPTQKAEDISLTSVNASKFSMIVNHVTPSLARYTPLPNSSDWIKNILQSKVTPLMNSSLRLASESELTITIPEIEQIHCNLNISGLNLTHNSTSGDHISSAMDISPTDDIQNLQDDVERNSISEAGSVASDLTRMCVSDEDEKVSF